MTDFKQIIESAQLNLAMHTEHAFACWVEGDALGTHIAWRGARRAEHVIRLARALSEG
jgi:hypothetical protein